ncbi:MAG: PEP/pyruvate-binding domain-containing protein [Desulfobacterales bacterium]
MAYYSHVSTGWEGLDNIIDYLRRGDNVVWQVDEIDAYRKMVSFFVNHAVADNERVIYMRFARHAPLLAPRRNIRICELDVSAGFESFTAQVHTVITREGNDVFYVFDSLSDLLHVWAADLMIVNFFFVTCPYLYELNTIAYFAILRNRHTFKAVAGIRETTQVLIDVYSYERKLCIHPIKIQNRYSPTMFFPHIKEKSELVPVINSSEATRLFSYLQREKAANAQRILDFWDRLFMQAQHLLESEAAESEKQDKVEQLSRLLLSRNKKLLALIRRFVGLEDLLSIKERLIGTGFIGGKAMGMLLARQVLLKNDSDWHHLLEHHDSYYIGSDVFYSYIVQNGWWKLFMAHKTPEGYFQKAAELKEKILTGTFPEAIREHFQLMLEYFGQSPIIVRSSSLLEDAFGSAFAGRYESFFCVNQTSPEKRYDIFEASVKKIYAGILNEDALAYRMQRGLDRMDEQMAIIVQRVSGAAHNSCFFPELAGVGLSHNPYVWRKQMKAEAGMMRLVFGLGTRAVNRVEYDYPRIVALDDPLAKPLAGIQDLKKYSQHYVDYLDLETNELETISLWDLAEKIPDFDPAAYAIRESQTGYNDYGAVSHEKQWILTFDDYLSNTPFVATMGKMLKTIENAYGGPIEIEFTANPTPVGDFQVNLLQCRPFQSIRSTPHIPVPEEIDPEKLFIRTAGYFMGGNVSLPITCIIWVDPRGYASASLSEKYSVARLIGKLNRSMADADDQVMLLGPGRWGTQTPAMGIPVTFSEINHVTALVEISYPAGSMVPDLSFGTHFFHDLTESGIFYAAVYPELEKVVFQTQWLSRLPNMLAKLRPSDEHLSHVVKVYHMNAGKLLIQSDIVTQKFICYRT